MQSAEPWRPTSPALPLLTCGQVASGSAVHPPGLLTGRHLPDSGWRTQGVKAHVTGGAAECGGARNEGDTSPRLGAGKPVGRREPLHKAISHTALSSKNSQTLCRVVLSRLSIPFFFFFCRTLLSPFHGRHRGTRFLGSQPKVRRSEPFCLSCCHLKTGMCRRARGCFS